VIQENSKNSRSSPKIGAKRKNDKNKSIQSVRLRPSEDNSFFPVRTEPSEDHGTLEQRSLLKSETYQALSSVSKRKTATFKERPVATAVYLVLILLVLTSPFHRLKQVQIHMINLLNLKVVD